MRESWDEYFMGIAWMVDRARSILATGYNGSVVSRRATCDRLHVGCVIVGRDHCDEAGHDLVNGHCVRTVHAEQNAIAQAARRGVSLANGIAYVTAYPCWGCAKLLANSGVHVVRYAKAYRIDERVTREFGDRIMHVDVEDPNVALERVQKEANEAVARAQQCAQISIESWKQIASDRAASLRRLTPHGGNDR